MQKPDKVSGGNWNNGIRAYQRCKMPFIKLKSNTSITLFWSEAFASIASQNTNSQYSTKVGIAKF